MSAPVTRRTLLRLAGAASLSMAAAAAARAEGFSILPDRQGAMFATTTPIHVRDVTLRVRDLAGMTDYYRKVLGLDLIAETSDTRSLGAGGVTLLTLAHRPNAPFEPPTEAGLYHTAFLMPSRADLAAWLVHAAMLNVPMTGFADHAVSEAIYLDDPEGNGIEVYADRAPELWGWNGDRVVMGSVAIDFDSLMALTDTSVDTYAAVPTGLRIGHIHLRAGQIDSAAAFYNTALGLDITSGRADALFLSSGRYHHHVALNTWQSAGAGPRNPDATGLARFTLLLADPAQLPPLIAQLNAAGHETTEADNGFSVIDPWGTMIGLVTA